MTRRTRRLFFYALVAVFVVLGTYLALAANGLVVDLAGLRIVKTGALFLKFSPGNARIYVDGKLQTASAGFLSSGVFLPNIAPGDYVVRLSADGYGSWTKDLAVQPGLVTAASQVQLWPDNWPTRTVESGSVSDFWLTGAGAVLKTASGSLRLDGQALRGQTVFASDPGGGAVVTESGGAYFWTNLSDPGSPVDVSALFESLRSSDLHLTGSVPITRIFFHPFNGNRLLIASNRAVYELDLRRRQLSLLFDTPGIAAAGTSNNEILALDDSGKLTIFNLLLQTTNSVSLGLKNVEQMFVSPDGSVFILLKDGSLERYDRSAKRLADIAGGVTGFWLSPGGERLAVAADGALKIIALKSYWSDVKVTAGDEWTADAAGDIDNFAWLPDYPDYGLILSGGRLSVAELDARKPQTTNSVASGVAKFYVSGSGLFFLQRGVLTSIDLGNI